MKRHSAHVVTCERRLQARKHADRTHTCVCGQVCRGNGGWSSHKRNCPAWSKARNLPVTGDRLYVLKMAHPEWPTTQPDARSVRHLQWLQRRGLVYQNHGRWYTNQAGRDVLHAAGCADE
jgi:hypothetical protein